MHNIITYYSSVRKGFTKLSVYSINIDKYGIVYDKEVKNRANTHDKPKCLYFGNRLKFL